MDKYDEFLEKCLKRLKGIAKLEKGWDFTVEILPDGAIEIDGYSNTGEALEPKTFDELTEEYVGWFNQFVLANINVKKSTKNQIART